MAEPRAPRSRAGVRRAVRPRRVRAQGVLRGPSAPASCRAARVEVGARRRTWSCLSVDVLGTSCLIRSSPFVLQDRVEQAVAPRTVRVDVISDAAFVLKAKAANECDG